MTSDGWCVRKQSQDRQFPALVKAGWTRHREDVAKLLIRSGRGGSFNHRLFRDLNDRFLMLRAIALALRARLREFGCFALFLDRAATPPSKGGDFRAQIATRSPTE